MDYWSYCREICKMIIFECSPGPEKRTTYMYIHYKTNNSSDKKIGTAFY